MKIFFENGAKILQAVQAGDLVSTNVGPITEALKPVFEARPGVRPEWEALRLDLSGAKMVDSVGLNFIVTLLRAVQSMGGRLQVAYANQNVLRTLQFTRLDRHLELIKA